jgi:cystathionine beta-synthase
MKDAGVSQLPVVDEGRLVGIVTETDVLGKIVDGRAKLDATVAEVMFRNVRTVNEAEDAGVLTKLFADGLVAMVVDDAGALKALVTKMDLVDYLTRPIEA